MHYFSNLFWSRTLYVSDRLTVHHQESYYRGAGKFLARPGRKQATMTDDLSFIHPICNNNWRNISTIYINNKTSIKRNILTIKINT
jgi:hypothetical protein